MTQDYSAKWWAAFISIAFLEAVLLMMLLTEQASLQLLFAIVVIAFLLFLIPRLDDVVTLTFERGKLENKLSTISKKLAINKARIEKLCVLSMPQPMYEKLKKVDSGNFGHYEMNEGLERELYHLRDIGYIEVGRIRDIPYEGNNLSEYVKITNFGKQFIEFRKSIEEEISKG